MSTRSNKTYSEDRFIPPDILLYNENYILAGVDDSKTDDKLQLR
jgi:hypothetical protein